jgi:hypothetical protein
MQLTVDAPIVNVSAPMTEKADVAALVAKSVRMDISDL